MLNLSESEREKHLERWPEPKREVLRRKCEVYHKLPPEERERRLKMVELRFYLQPLMVTPQAERHLQLAQVPEEFRTLVLERLAQWDRLGPDVQKRLLENEMALHYFARLRQGSTTRPIPAMQPSTPDQRQNLEAKLSGWAGLNAAARRKSYQQFNRFFELRPQEQERTLQTISDAERIEMEKTVAAFSKLTPSQRRLCVESFQKFSEFSSSERLEFLRNAARWQAMSTQERQQWRTLVNHLPPTPEFVPIPPAPRLPVQSQSNVLGN